MSAAVLDNPARCRKHQDDPLQRMARPFSDFLNHIKAGHPDYYNSCSSAADDILAVFGVRPRDDDTPEFGVPIWSVGDTKDYKLDELTNDEFTSNRLSSMDAKTAVMAANEAAADVDEATRVANEAEAKAADARDWLAKKVGSLRVAAAQKSAHSFANTEGPIRRFFTSTIFDKLGGNNNVPDNVKERELTNAVETFLGAIAPDTPTIDDHYTLTSLPMKTVDGNTVHILAVRATTSTIPLYFEGDPRSPLFTTANDAMTNGFLQLSKTNHNAMICDPPLKEHLFLRGKNGIYHADFADNASGTKIQTPAMVLTSIKRIDQAVLRKLTHVTVNGRTGKIEAFLPCLMLKQTNVRPDVDDAVKRHNTMWDDYQTARSAWRVADSADPKRQVMYDLLLLDLSRFGFSPTWSTPWNTNPRMEDGKAASFKNDIAEFMPVVGRNPNTQLRELKKKFATAASQRRSQWMCTRFLHSNYFYQLRRRDFLRSFMNSGDESNAVMLFKTENREAYDWVNGDEAEFQKQCSLDHQLFVENVQAYTQFAANDIPQLCLCFTITRLRVAESVRLLKLNNALSVEETAVVDSVLRQQLFVIRQLRFVALKAISVPAHETLKLPIRSWTADVYRIGKVLERQFESMRHVVESVAVERKQLVSAFISSVSAKRLERRPMEGKPTLVRSSVPFAAALFGFDKPVLCARVRMVLPSSFARDAALERFETLATKSVNAKDLLAKFAETPSDDAFFNDRGTKDHIKEFVRLYSESTATEYDLIKTEFKRLYEVQKNSNQQLRTIHPEAFICDHALNGVLQNTLNSSSTTSYLSPKFRSFKYKRRFDSTGALRPLIFADGETEILMVAELDISQVATTVKDDHHRNVYIPADVEIDTLMRLLSKTCPANAPPNESVQTQFARLLSTGETLNVARLDWWIGNATEYTIESYNDAAALIPFVPVALSEEQLVTQDSELATDVNDETTPFDSAVVAAKSIAAVENSIELSLQPFAPGSINSVLQETNSMLTDLFTNEVDLELAPFDSLCRVCRIAFELLKGNGFDKDLNGNTYESVASTYVSTEQSVIQHRDLMAVVWLNTRTAIGTKRANNALSSNHLDTLLVPYQHGPMMSANEKRVLYLDTVAANDMFRHDHVVVALIRLLQLRISNSSYAVKRLRVAHRSLDNFHILRQQFEFTLQNCTRYQTNSLEQYTSSDKLSTDSRMLAKYLFPLDFENGRRVDHSNLPISVLSSQIYQNKSRDTAALYMTTAVSTLKRMNLFETAQRVDTEAYGRLRRIMREMASIADGMNSARPFLKFLVQAAKALPIRYKGAKNTTKLLSAQTRPMIDEFSANHAKFDDAMRSYADVASAGFLDIDQLKGRFLAAYQSIRKFKLEYDSGSHGMLVFIANELNCGTFRRQTSVIVKTFFAAIERLIVSEFFVSNVTELDAQLDLNTTFESVFPLLGNYTTLAARFHMNSALGCVTSASPFRDVQAQIKTSRHQKALRTSLGFDTLNGFIDEAGHIASFHCFLPTANDVFQDGIPENCHPVSAADAQYADRTEQTAPLQTLDPLTSSGGVANDQSGYEEVQIRDDFNLDENEFDNESEAYASSNYG